MFVKSVHTDICKEKNNIAIGSMQSKRKRDASNRPA